MSIFRTGREVEELKDDLVSARGTIAELEKRIAELEAKPDASAGLIEAAEWHEAKALAHSTRNFSDQRIVSWHRDCALALRSRAADRSA